jgi:hypothetical protein
LKTPPPLEDWGEPKRTQKKGDKEAMTMTSALVMMLAETAALGAMFWVGWTMWPRNRG